MIDVSDIMCDIEAAVEERLWEMTEKQRRQLAAENVSGYEAESSGYDALVSIFNPIELADLLGIDIARQLYIARQEEREREEFIRQHRVAI